MLSGNIAKIESQSDALSGLQEASSSGDSGLSSHIEIRGETSVNGTTLKQGIAVDEYYTTEEQVTIDGRISVSEEEVIKHKWTSFWVSENEFVVVKNSKGTFAFDIVERAIDGDVDPAQFDLQGIINRYPGQWMGTFGDRPDNVNKGTLFGEEIESDPEIGDAYQDSSKNQIGVEIPYQGKTYKVRVGEHFVQLYGVNDREEWLEFVDQRMLEFLN